MAPRDTRTLLDKIHALPEERIAQVEDFVDFLMSRVNPGDLPAVSAEPLEFPVDDLGPWPDGLSLRRVDLYGDDGR